MSGRSLVDVTAAFNDAGEPVLTCMCDCGMTTDVVVAGLQPIDGLVAEFAFTCDGCQSSHWITIAAEK
jgi:hypothetical protein